MVCNTYFSMISTVYTYISRCNVLKTVTYISFTTDLSLACAHVTSLRAKAWISKWMEVSSRANFTATQKQHSAAVSGWYIQLTLMNLMIYSDYLQITFRLPSNTNTHRFVLQPWSMNLGWTQLPQKWSEASAFSAPTSSSTLNQSDHGGSGFQRW